MAEVLKNLRVTVLDVDTGIDHLVTEFDVADASVFGAGVPFRISMDEELMTVTAVADNTLTVTRGIEGSSAIAHAPLTEVYCVLTAGAIQQAIDDGIAAIEGGGSALMLSNFLTEEELPAITEIRIDGLDLVDDGPGIARIAYTVPAKTIIVREVDGAPTEEAVALEFPNGTLTEPEAGVVRYTPSGGGAEAFCGALARKGNDQTFFEGSEYGIDFPDEDYDTDSIHGASTTRLYVPTGKGGYWQVWWSLHLEGLGTDKGFMVVLNKNDSSDIIRQRVRAGTSGNVGAMGSVVVNLSAGDFVNLRGAYDSGTGSCSFITTWPQMFGMHKVG